VPLGGDRLYGEDQAIIGGFATLNGRKVMLIGHEKGHDTATRIKHNFGMGKPEGYRKAIRLMELAGRFGLPVVTLVDTSGAFPGVEAEERGQAEAIARSTEACLALRVPMVAVIVGEGGSGGAVALASAERVLMLEHAVYSVISPEGCASILWRTAEKAADAAEAMKVTAQDLLGLKVIDRIVPEPIGGAHRDPDAAAKALGKAIGEELDKLLKLDAKQCWPCAKSVFWRLAPNKAPYRSITQKGRSADGRCALFCADGAGVWRPCQRRPDQLAAALAVDICDEVVLKVLLS
jgi:acetyl-CoA carboxylase carboxyl transferase subunit alpha